MLEYKFTLDPFFSFFSPLFFLCVSERNRCFRLSYIGGKNENVQNSVLWYKLLEILAINYLQVSQTIKYNYIRLSKYYIVNYYPIRNCNVIVKLTETRCYQSITTSIPSTLIFVTFQLYCNTVLYDGLVS